MDDFQGKRVHRSDLVTARLLVTQNACDGVLKWKNLNGSPGRARTADLVINSSTDTLSMAWKA